MVVSTGSSVALQDARKALEMFHQVKVEVLGLVENMSQMRPARRDNAGCLRRGRHGAHGGAVRAGVSGVGRYGSVSKEGAGTRECRWRSRGGGSALGGAFYEVADRVIAAAEKVAEGESDVSGD